MLYDSTFTSSFLATLFLTGMVAVQLVLPSPQWALGYLALLFGKTIFTFLMPFLMPVPASLQGIKALQPKFPTEMVVMILVTAVICAWLLKTDKPQSPAQIADN